MRLKRNRSWLVSMVAAELEMDPGVVRTVIDAFLDEISHEVAGGSVVGLENFGVFRRGTRRVYEAPHPKTREKVEMRPKVRVLFKAGKQLQDKIDAEMAKGVE